MPPPTPPPPLQELREQLLVCRGWRYLRYLHLRAALGLLPELRSVLSVLNGRGEAELALAVEHPRTHFTLARVRGSAGSFKRARKLAWRLGLRNVSFTSVNLARPAWWHRRHELVATTELLECQQDVAATLASLSSLSSRYLFNLVSFAEAEQNDDPQQRQRALEKHGHQVVGFDADGLLRLLPQPLALRGCYWREAGANLRQQLMGLEETEIREGAASLQQLADFDLRPAWPARHSEAEGLWILSELDPTPRPRGLLGALRRAPLPLALPPAPVSDRRLIELSGLFDAAHYAKQYPNAGDDSLGCYLTSGARAQHWPRADFDPDHYCRLAGIDPAVENPLAHYLREGRARGLAPHPSGLHPGEHRVPLTHEDRHRPLLLNSGLFDAAYYLSTSPDVRKRRLDPLAHYLRHGAREGRRPNRLFDPGHYSRLAGIDPTVTNPLVHYVSEGDARGLSPHPSFDVEAYLTANPDCRERKRTLLAHYLERQHKLQAIARVATKAGPGESASAIDIRRVRVTVLVPIYNGAEHLRRCVNSLIAETRLPAVELLLIDDGSPEPAVGALLDELAGLPRVTITRNPVNLGFTRTVNRGLELAADRDVVLLNSDTVVGPGWLEQLLLAAYAEPSIASATALSDSAGAFSTPAAGPNATHERVDVPSGARLSRRAAPTRALSVPTGNGFCMYVRRDALDAVGPLDAEAFPRGYGEENDWCLRATELGFRHVIALRAYVAHVNAASFGEAKARLVAAARQVLDGRHPDYGLLLAQSFRPDSPLALQRLNLQAALADHRNHRVRPRLLFVVSTSTGGTPQTNQDLMRGLRSLYQPLLLTCDSRRLTLHDADSEPPRLLAEHELSEPVRLVGHRSSEYDAVVARWLVEQAVELVHIRHLGWHSLSLPRLARGLGLRVVYSLHDFYTVCPSVNLVAGHQRWQPRGVTEPHIVAPLWERRDPEGLAAVQRLSPPTFLAAWQRRMDRVLADCDALVTTAESVRALMLENLPEARRRPEDFVVIPHGRDFSAFRAPPPPPAPGEPLRLLVLGNINEAKGMMTLLRLVELDTERRFELHILGNARQQLRATRRIHTHGTYQREELLHRIAQLRPHLSLVLSIWPETFCHTLTESWAAGLPVVGSELGAVGERIDAAGAGWTVDAMDAEALYALLTRLGTDGEEYARKAAAVERWQREVGQVRTVAAMASDYVALYRRVLRGARAFAGPERRRSRPRVGLIAQGHYPTAPGSVHVRLATAVRAARGTVDYDWVTAGEVVRQGAEDLDGLLVCRNAAAPSILVELARASREASVPLVLDLDDDLLRVPEGHDTRAQYAADAAGIEALLAEARVVTVATPELLETYRPHARDVRLLENRLDAEQWLAPVPRAAAPPLGHAPEASLRVLYCGTLTHGEDLSLVLPVFAQLAALGVVLHVIGVEREERPGYARLVAPDPRYDRFVPWLRGVAPYFDVAIAPLVDSPFNRAKSALKYLELAACGLPVLASNVGAYARTIRHDVDGLLASDRSSWSEQLQRLLHEPELRARLAQEARVRLERDFVCRSCPYDELPWRGSEG